MLKTPLENAVFSVSQVLRRLPLSAALVLLMTVDTATAEWMDWRGEIGLVLGDDDNVNIAARGRDKRHDEFLDARARVSRRYALPEAKHSGAFLRVGADIARSEYSEFDGLSGWRGGVWIGYQQKYGLGALAPRFTVRASAHYDKPDDQYREHWEYRLLAAGTIPLTPRVTATARGMAVQRSGRDWQSSNLQLSSSVFDQARIELGGELRVRVQASTRFYFRADYLDGEFDAFCGPGTSERLEQVAGIPGVKAVALDQVFGSCRWLLDGDGWRYQAGAEFAMSPTQAVELSWEESDIRIDTGQSYERAVVRLAWRYAF